MELFIGQQEQNFWRHVANCMDARREAQRRRRGFGCRQSGSFHAVGPVWHGGSHGEDELLAGCYRRCLELAKEHGVKSLAYSAISTGVYGFPSDRAAKIAVATVRKHFAESGVETVLFVCFNEDTYSIYRRLLEIN